MGRLGKFGARLGGVLGALLWPSPLADGRLPNWFHDLSSPDPNRRRAAEEAQRLYRGDPALRPDLEEWYTEETEDLPQPQPQLKQKPSDDEDAGSRRQTLPDLGPSVRIDEDEDQQQCPWIVICFMPKTANYDPVEFRRQLSEQEIALQTMPPSGYIGNRGRIRADGTTEIARNSPRARRAYNQIWSKWEKTYGSPPGDGSLAALHALDIVAGGDPASFLRIGPHRENRIMGSQWAQGQGVQGGDRLNRLDAHAARLQGNGCPKMNARLRVCPGRGMDAEGEPL